MCNEKGLCAYICGYCIVVDLNCFSPLFSVFLVCVYMRCVVLLCLACVYFIKEKRWKKHESDRGVWVGVYG